MYIEELIRSEIILADMKKRSQDEEPLPEGVIFVKVNFAPSIAEEIEEVMSLK